MNLDQSRYDAQELSKVAAEWEAEFNDLKRKEPGVLAKCISKQIDQEKSFQWHKNTALQDSEYLEHLEKMKEAQQKYLEADKSFRTIIEYLKAIQSENYKRHQELKAGII